MGIVESAHGNLTSERTSGAALRSGFEVEYPFRSHFLDIAGVKYHYLDEGEGEVLLLVHGNPTWSFAWRNFVKDLSEDYRVVAVDHIGCGLSDKPQDYPYNLDQHIRNLSQLIAELDLRRVTLIAHDWGGAIGMGTAGRMADRFERFVLCNTAAFRSRKIPWRIAACRIPVLGAWGVRGLNLFARAALSMAVSHHARMTPPVCAGYLAPYQSWADRVAILRFVEDIPLEANHPSYGTLTEIESQLPLFCDRPMLLAWGERDWCFTVDFLSEFERRFPQAEVFRLSDAGHYIFEDAYERLIPRIRAFLAAHPHASA